MTDALLPTVPMDQVRRDLRLVQQVGLRHVRLPISPSSVLSWPAAGPGGSALERLDAVVCAALERGLTVVLDAHPEDALALTDAAQADALDRLGAAWDRLAGHFAIVPPGAMVFEALNEPGVTDGGRWAAAQASLLAHIRRAAPRHTVLLTAAPNSTAAALAGLDPVKDSNVSYVFHFYSPMLFTHQGAEWATPNLGSVRGLAYPARTANVDEVRRAAWPAYGPALSAYDSDYRSKPTALPAEIGLAAAWAKRHGVRLIATEFGAFWTGDPVSRATWLHDVRAALETRGIGWTVWEFRGGFGIAAGLADRCGTATSIRTALGLCGGGPHESGINPLVRAD